MNGRFRWLVLISDRVFELRLRRVLRFFEELLSKSIDCWEVAK